MSLRSNFTMPRAQCSVHTHTYTRIKKDLFVRRDIIYYCNIYTIIPICIEGCRGPYTTVDGEHRVTFSLVFFPER